MSIFIKYCRRQKKKDGSKNEIIVDKQFYGPASSCAEISELGYTLNDYYLVKVKNQSIVGFINIEINSTKSVQRRSTDELAEKEVEEIYHVFDRSKRPARLLPKMVKSQILIQFLILKCHRIVYFWLERVFYCYYDYDVFIIILKEEICGLATTTTTKKPALTSSSRVNSKSLLEYWKFVQRLWIPSVLRLGIPSKYKLFQF